MTKPAKAKAASTKAKPTLEGIASLMPKAKAKPKAKKSPITNRPTPKKAAKAKKAAPVAEAQETAPLAQETAPAATLAHEAPAEAEATKKLSALDAAAEVLRDFDGVPLNCPDLIHEMQTRGLWTSPGGKTPAATLHAAISAEIRKKGTKARFKKGEHRGRFTLNTNA